MGIVASELIAAVTVEGIDTAEAQMLSMGAASDAAATALATSETAAAAWATTMREAGLEAFTFDEATKSFTSNMEASAPAADAAAAAVDAVKVAVQDTVPSVAELDAQFAAMQTRFAEVSAEADMEAAAMMRDAEANLRNAEASKVNTASAEKATVAHKGLHITMSGLMSTLFNLAFAYELLVKPLFNAVGAVTNFQQNLLKLYTTAGEAKSNLDMVGKGILAMSADVGIGANELLKGMYYVESAGFHGAAGLNVLRIAAEGAKAENSDLIGVAHALTGVLVTYASTGITAAQAMNVLIGSVSQGSNKLNDLSGAISNVLPAGSKFHLQLIDLTTAIATMTNQNDNAASAATHLRQVILALESPAKAGAKALAEIGLSSDALHAAMSKSLPGAIQLIIDLLGKKFPVGSAAYNDALKAIAGGNKQLMGLLELSGTSLDKWKQAVKAVTGDVKAGGDAVMGWADVQKNFNFQLDRAKAFVEKLAIQIGTQLLPFLTGALQAFNDSGKFLSTVFGPAIQAVSGWMRPFSDSVTNVGRALSTLFAPAIKSISDTMKGFSAGSFGQFLGQLAGGIMQNLTQGMMTFAQWVRDATPTLQKLGTIFGQIATFLRDTFAPVWDQLKQSIHQLQPVLQQLSPYLLQLAQFFGAVLVLALGIFVGILAGVIKGIAGLLQGIILFVTGAIQFFTGFMQFFSGVFAFLHDLFTGKWSKLWADAGLILKGFVNMVQGLVGMIAGIFVGGFSAINGFVSGFVQGIVGFFKNLSNILVGHSIIPDMINSIVSWFAQLPGRALAAVAALAGRLAGFFGGLASQAFAWGRNIITNLANGIMAGISAAVAAASAVAAAVARVLHHSKPEEGPLRDDDVWGLHLAQNFAAGLRAGTGEVQAAMAGMFGAAMGNMSVSHSIGSFGSGSHPMPTYFGGGGSGGITVVHVHPIVQADMYVDGRKFTDEVTGPHMVSLSRLQTGSRRAP